MNEKTLEKKLREKIKASGGLALKFVSPGYTGVPDRIVLMPGGRIYFVELKTSGEKPRKRQEYVHKVLRNLGFEVFVVDDNASLAEFLKRVSL